MIPSTATVKFGPEGVARVDSSLHLSGRTHIQCCLYEDYPAILSLTDEHVSVSVSVPDRHQVAAADVALARDLAAAVGQYVADLEKRAAVTE